MMLTRQTILTITILLSGVFGASAERLPKTAVPLSGAEAKSLYAGKSSNWTKVRAYFAPDGSYYMAGKDKSFYGEGTWSVTGNKVCTKLTWHAVKGGKSGTGGDCWTWYRDGKRYLTFWSGEKDKVDGYYDGELKKLAKGDKVTSTYEALSKKKAP